MLRFARHPAKNQTGSNAGEAVESAPDGREKQMRSPRLTECKHPKHDWLVLSYQAIAPSSFLNSTLRPMILQFPSEHSG
jgi:hypothetical protein